MTNIDELTKLDEGIWNDTLLLREVKEILKVKDDNREWEIRNDRYGEKMVFYKNIPCDEIIYCVGEISLAMTSNITSLQQEYYEEDIGDVFNIAVKLIRDNNFAKEFYFKYNTLRSK